MFASLRAMLDAESYSVKDIKFHSYLTKTETIRSAADSSLLNSEKTQSPTQTNNLVGSTTIEFASTYQS